MEIFKKEFSIFNKKAKEKITKISNQEIVANLKRVKNITEEVIIRNKEDTFINLSLNQRGLGVYSDEDTLISRLKYDMNLVSPEDRVKRVLVFDTETTDLYNAYAVSIALIVYNIETKEVEKEFYSLINPLDIISEGSIKIHGIKNSDVQDKPTFESLLDVIESYLEGVDFLSGHNLNFDMNVLEREYHRLNKVNPFVNYDIFDTMLMSKDVVKVLDIKGKIKNPRLDECISFFNIDLNAGVDLKEENTGFHNALYDTRQTLAVFKELMN